VSGCVCLCVCVRVCVRACVCVFFYIEAFIKLLLRHAVQIMEIYYEVLFMYRYIFTGLL
jgi:hypothetical protein